MEFLAVEAALGHDKSVDRVEFVDDLVVAGELFDHDDLGEFGFSEVGAGDEGGGVTGMGDDVPDVFDVANVLLRLLDLPWVGGGAKGIGEFVATMPFGPDATREFDDVGGDGWWNGETDSGRLNGSGGGARARGGHDCFVRGGGDRGGLGELHGDEAGIAADEGLSDGEKSKVVVPFILA